MSKFKDFIDNDIEEFRKLNIGILEESKDELVSKIEKKYGLRNDSMELINDINKLLGKKKFGFSSELLESDKLDKQLKLSKKRRDAIKMKFFELNSTFSDIKTELERKLNEDRYYSEIRVFDEKGNDYINNIYKDSSKTPEVQLKKAYRYAKRQLKGEQKVKINVFDTRHPEHGEWNILSKTIKI